MFKLFGFCCGSKRGPKGDSEEGEASQDGKTDDYRLAIQIEGLDNTGDVVAKKPAEVGGSRSSLSSSEADTAEEGQSDTPYAKEEGRAPSRSRSLSRIGAGPKQVTLPTDDQHFKEREPSEARGLGPSEKSASRTQSRASLRRSPSEEPHGRQTETIAICKIESENWLEPSRKATSRSPSRSSLRRLPPEAGPRMETIAISKLEQEAQLKNPKDTKIPDACVTGDKSDFIKTASTKNKSKMKGQVEDPMLVSSFIQPAVSVPLPGEAISLRKPIVLTPSFLEGSVKVEPRKPSEKPRFWRYPWKTTK